MRALIQRVTAASVSVDGSIVGRIEPKTHGLVALIGVTHTDTNDHAANLARKVWELRVLEGEKSCADLDAPILVISQFTLYADTRKGRRPSWNDAAKGDVAGPLVAEFVRQLAERGATVAEGVFGAHMEVSLVNDGPVTVLLEV
ncbi:D-aminoacyl-tRNA deacylase [Smaragdicoccus niigatensis]|uniref:D-aminoacyl-tRNA deacylase n=1 Tax=Smaragdicoccus niigatensis TaxID=359359 RepID=UPI00037E042A|nr:D-aminoacyl-tRNA deacylase [Smaragdicoccus niigatensis]